jgi:cytochrome P450
MAINETVAAVAPAPKHVRNNEFVLNALKSRSITDKLFGWALRDPRWLFALLRCWPRAGFWWFGWTVVTRFDHVREVLAHNEVFHVPYAEKTMDLNGGPNFLLGMEDGELYRRYQKLVMRAFRLEEAQSVVAREAACLSRDILNHSAGRIDAVEGLLTRVAVLICEKYYGLPIPDPTVFGHWTIAMSTHIFVDATKVVPAHCRAAEAAAKQVRALVNEAIAAAKGKPPASDTVLSRLVAMQASEPDLTDETIRAFLIGMVLGFVPTNTLAAGNILAVLLSRQNFMAQARAAALSGDDDLLRRCLFEALRFKHIHWGLTRICAKDYTLAEGAGFFREKRVRAGGKVLASTWSAMFDGTRVENPNLFDPSRRSAEYMLLGYGLHWCIGAYIAYAQITQTFKALLVQNDLRPMKGKKGRLQLVGDFPQHLWMHFKVPIVEIIRADHADVQKERN